MIRFFFALFSLSFMAMADYEKISQELSKEVKSLNEKLTDERTKRFTEREKLRRENALKSSELVKLQSVNDDKNKSAEQLLLEIESLEKEIRQDEKILKAVDVNLTQVRRELQTLIPPIEKSSQEKFQQFDESPEIESFGGIVSKLLSDGFSNNIQDVEGLDENGEKKNGKLLAISHALYYLQIGDSAGIAVSTLDHDIPSVKPIAGTVEAFNSLQSGSKANLSFDFTEGLAFKDEAKTKTLLEHFKAGGVIIYPLLILGILCIITGIYKSLQLYIIRSQYDDKVSKLVGLIKQGDTSGAEAYVNSLKNPIRSLLQEALKNHQQSRTNLEEILNETILEQLPRLDRFLPILSVSAGAAPLLGLLGTVMGIIKTFEMISIYGTGEANRMAGGISEALVTTEAGLIVAIPALIWYAVLNRRLKSIVGNLEKAMLGFINAIALEEK